ncbi:MAG: hypothetical protein J7502_14330 [Flavisolibacter sp.]|nr:hypothetical protein [Flavisolibacter sp.]
MKLILLIVLLCGLNPTTHYSVRNKKIHVDHPKTTSANFDMLPSGLLFQF